MESFRTHTGEVVTGARLQAALNAVADDWAALGHAIRKEDHYASHVSEEQKDANLADHLARAEAIRAGDVQSFTIIQRLDTKLTGECVALLGQTRAPSGWEVLRGERQSPPCPWATTAMTEGGEA